MLYSIDDITLIPGIISPVSSRSDCDPCYGRVELPVIASPMSCVINQDNIDKFTAQGINAVVPRSIPYKMRVGMCSEHFVAMSLDELRQFIKTVDRNLVAITGVYICLDIANGHMTDAISLAAKAKKIDGITLMVGNIANPQTYLEYARIGVDYIRVGIGTGSVCSTSMVCGMHYPMGSLIIETNKLREKYGMGPKIVADGGFHTNDQIIKALALGADYCMLGEIFAKTKESCGKIIQADEEYTYKEYYGMSTKKAQREFGKDGNKHEEGFYKVVKVEYTLAEWIDRFKHDLTDAMSYAGVFCLEDFIGNIEWDVISPLARLSYYKDSLLK